MSSPRLHRRSLLQGLAVGGAGFLAHPMAAVQAEDPGRLKRRAPESLGIDSRWIGAFVDAVERKVGGLHSLMLLRHGQVAAEAWWAPYGPEHPHMLYSLSKSFTSTAVGLAVAEGLLSVDARVTSFFPEDLPTTLDSNLRAMRVRHLLSMSTGHERDATAPTAGAQDGNWVKAFLGLPVQFEPGTRFVYNSAATYMCSAILQKITGRTVLQYLTPRLFAPLGIAGPTWETDPRGINTGGWGLKVKTEDIARFGQLYLQRGQWRGKQLLAETWVADATRKHIDNGANPNSDWSQGYGYQFWRCRHGAYRGDGAFGQYCVVMPEQDAVLAITSGLGDMQAVLDCVWEHLLPGMHPAGVDGGDGGALKRKLGGLSVATPAGGDDSPDAGAVSLRTYRLQANDEKIESIRVEFHGRRAALTLTDAGGPRRLAVGIGQWVHGTAPLALGGLFPGRSNSKVAARGVWTDARTFVARVCFVETPYVETWTLAFEGSAITVKRALNVSFGARERPTLVGKAV